MRIEGKTYSLYGSSTGTDAYYRAIRKLTDALQEKCPDEEVLLSLVQRACGKSSLTGKSRSGRADSQLASFIKKTLKESLAEYTTGVKQHLESLPLLERSDAILRTGEYQYHLYMIEIELINRIYREGFRRSDYRFALIGHCLRDFRPECQSAPGDYESACRGCTEDCYIHLGSVLLRKYGIQPFISVSMDLEKLFKRIRAGHTSVGALGIACIPELVQGMRLCIRLNIPAVGIPLDANRCARWMKQCRESSFSLKELEKLIQQ